MLSCCTVYVLEVIIFTFAKDDNAANDSHFLMISV